MSTVQLSVVIPAYEEAENLATRIPQIVETCTALQLAFEIIIVDTMQPRDATPDMCRQFPHVIYQPRTGGNNYGDAIRTGIRASRGERVLIMDADGSHDPRFIATLWAQRNVADVIIASRYVAGGATRNPRALIWMSRVLNWIYRIALGIPCADVSNSFKLYRGDWLRGLPLTCDHFDIVEEILIQLTLRHPDVHFHEVPAVFYERDKGVTKRNLLAFIWSYGKTLRKLRALKQQYQAAAPLTKESAVCKS